MQTKPIESVKGKPGSTVDLRMCIYCKQFGVATLAMKQRVGYVAVCTSCLERRTASIARRMEGSR